MLNEIERWTEDPNGSPVFWLNGLAGTGKSAIAQTVAERVFADGSLGASFFCSRGVEDRSDLQLIFPTLAFQLAQKYPAFRSLLIPLLQSNPDVVHESLQDQMQKFLVEPLKSADISTTIVIDALDECRDEDPESAILLILGQSICGIPGIKFFVTSRPEAHIITGFRGPLLKESTNVFILHGVEPRTIGSDIRHFFEYKLSELSRRHGGIDGWPTDEDLDSLCRRADGFFVYAVATVNFLDHHLQHPSDQLKTIMASPESTVHEGETELKVYTSLDSLYMSVFEKSFRKNKPEDDAMIRSILSATILVTNPLSPSAIATLLGFRCNQVQRLLELIQSLLVLPEDPNYPVQPFHNSFSDFITDPTRCRDLRFHLSPDYHPELVLHCLELMDKSLKKNMCSIPDYYLNSEVEDLSKRIEDSGIRGALEYACRSWYKHLTMTKHRSLDMFTALCNFLEKKFVFWLEVLSVLGAVGDAARALIAITKWLNEVCLTVLLLDSLIFTQSQVQVSIDVDTLLSTTADCLRFVTEFFEIISQSAPHICHSALLLVPRSSIVRRLYSQQIHSVARAVTGIPASWDSCTASTGTMEKVHHAVWSPCGQFIAAGFASTIEVRDSNTLERVSVFRPPDCLLNAIPQFIAFSPNGHLLACSYDW